MPQGWLQVVLMHPSMQLSSTRLVNPSENEKNEKHFCSVLDFNRNVRT
jgi:hypothetical protein